MHGGHSMTTTGSVPYVNRYQDRAAYAQWLASVRSGGDTPKQAFAQVDESDLAVFKCSETTAALARGEGVVVAIGDIKLKMHDPLTHYDETYSGPPPIGQHNVIARRQRGPLSQVRAGNRPQRSS